MNLSSIRFNSGTSKALTVGLAASLLAICATQATPYATCLTNNSGTISFRLNESASKVQVLWNGGASVTNLGTRPKGLTVTNLGAVTSPFYVQVVGVGNNTIVTNAQVPFNSPRGVTVNLSPASPNFGRIFVANTAAGTKGLGVYVHQSDFTDIFGAARTGGISFGTGGSAPWRLTVGEDDDRLYICDWTDNKGNLYVSDQDVSSGSYALQPLGPCLDGTVNAATDAGNPVGITNNHGSVAAVAVWGSTAAGNLTIVTVDEDLQDDRTSTTANQMNSVWRYDVGSASLPYNAYIGDPALLTNRLLTPNIQFVSNVEGLSHGTNGYLYYCQGRSSGNEPGVYVITNIYTASQYAWNDENVWNSYTVSRAMGSSADILLGAVACSVSRDGRWLASVNYNNNRINIVRLTNGVPDLSRRVQYTGLGTTGFGRDIAWDAANNLIYSSSGLANVYQISLGLIATNTTGSDGTFVSSQPPLVEVIASTNLAHRTDIVGNFTLFRSGDVSQPLTVNYTIGGTATNGVDYTTVPTSITFPAGVDSIDLPIVPLNLPVAKAPVTVVLTLKTGAAYNLVEARTATVVIADNHKPLISITRNYTSMYERLANDFIRFTITRLGETNIGLSLNITNGGTAVNGTDYTGPNGVSGGFIPIALDFGVTTKAVEYNPLPNNTAEGPLSVIIGVDAASDDSYDVGDAVATFTLYDSDLAPETVLWSDDFESYLGTAANTTPSSWAFKYAANNTVNDYGFTFGYDYSMDGLLPAPNSSTTVGLKATVNKDTTAAAAALNFYPVGQSFSGNYALRFSMLQILGSSNNTEHAIFGINHSGSKTNWNRSGGLSNTQATNQDGIWCSVSPSVNSGWDYCFWTAGTGTSTTPGIVTNRTGNPATGMNQVFKNDNLASANTTGNTPLATGPYAANGAPGCSAASTAARNWVDVEVAQTANMVVLRLNGQVVLATTNATAFTSGDVMLGYNDMFDSIGDPVAAAVYYDNVRVVRITSPTILTQPSSVVAAAGNPASFTVVASTPTSVTNYQWYLNNAPIAGATNATLSLASVASTDYGAYKVIVDDGSYPVSSDVVTLTPPLPVIDVQPVSLVAVVGSSPSFSVVATTYSGITNYQWMYYGTNLTGKTTSTLTLANVQPISFGGPYTVRVSDGTSSVTSSPPATLTIASSPSISAPGVTEGGYALSFTTEVGPSYVVDFKSALTNATWTALSTNVGTGSVLTVTNAMTGPEGYYRIRLQ